MHGMTSAVLTEMREKRELCDLEIQVGKVKIDAHKVILCSCSSYFRALLTGPWASIKKQKYTIPGVSSEMMSLIINYAYTNSAPVTEDNVVELLAAADQLLVTGLVQSCWFFLEDQLSPRNCIGIWKLMSVYYMPEQTDTIIESDHLNLSEEYTVFEAILSWINYQPDQRNGHISELLSKVRLGLMNVYYLQNVMDNDVVRNSIKCFPILDEALKVSLNFSRYSKSIYKNMLSRPRLPSTILLVTGGEEDGVYATDLEAYDARADLLGHCQRCLRLTAGTMVHRCTQGGSGAGATTLNGKVYVCGGYNGHRSLSTAECYDPDFNQWTLISAMRTSRSGLGVAAYRNRIYAVGGTMNVDLSLHTVEAYNPETNSWNFTPSMLYPRSYFDIEVVDASSFWWEDTHGGGLVPSWSSDAPNLEETPGASF
ncbi:hypothetical protein KUCAC02_030256 [Chaenocephalus aceratus]|uniref:Uncharacterized protein n=1 Tax=Chaenocephalus aceratus TaxID=36190 RepID=A0ACB9XI79_CHAAC|nr:hypothetical protein KUCAC02_030256 [Chaenocephalus aceratus]